MNETLATYVKHLHNKVARLTSKLQSETDPRKLVHLCAAREHAEIELMRAYNA